MKTPESPRWGPDWKRALTIMRSVGLRTQAGCQYMMLTINKERKGKIDISRGKEDRIRSGRWEKKGTCALMNEVICLRAIFTVICN